MSAAAPRNRAHTWCDSSISPASRRHAVEKAPAPSPALRPRSPRPGCAPTTGCRVRAACGREWRALRRESARCALHARRRAARDELQVGVSAREIHARPRLPGLDDHRPALRRRQRGQGAAHVVIFAAVIEQMHLCRDRRKSPLSRSIRIASGSTLSHRSQRDLHVLLRALVAHVVLDHLVVAVVGGFVLVGRGHRVPGDAAAGDVIERS